MEWKGKEDRLLVAGPVDGDGGVKELSGDDLELAVVVEVSETDKDVRTRGEDKELPRLTKGVCLGLFVPDELSLAISVGRLGGSGSDTVQETVLVHVIPEGEVVEPFVLELGDHKGACRLLSRERRVVGKQ